MTRQKWLSGIAFLTLTLSGCTINGLGGSSQPAAPAASPTRAGDSDSAEQPAQPGNDSNGEEARQPSAPTEATVNGGDNTTVDVEVVSLKRRGKLLDLELTLTPHRQGGIAYISLENLYGTGTPEVVTLTDNVNLKRYLVVKDSAGHLLQPVGTILQMDKATPLTYTFPAPPESVTALDVNIASWPPFRDVPVET